LPRTDVARVDTKLVHSLLHRHQRETVSKMNVGDERYRNLSTNFPERTRVCFMRHRNPDNFATGVRKGVNLSDGSVYVSRVRGAHGLNRHRGTTANLYSADRNATGCGPEGKRLHVRRGVVT
jgi:hypothetical protein